MGRLLLLRIGFLSLTGISSITLGQTVTLSLGSGQGVAGGSVVLPITITSAGGAQAAGIQWTISYSTDITGVTVALGSSASSAQKSLYCNGNKCLIVGLNSTVIADGTVASATFQIGASPSAQTIPLQIGGVVVTTAAGSSIPASGGSASISVSSVSPTLSGVACAPTTVNTPGNSSCTVSLTSVALLGGFAVPLSSNNTNVTAPSSVNVLVGQSSGGFTATAAQVSADQSGVITAGSGGTAKSVTLSLLAPARLTSLDCSPAALSGGASSLCTVSLNKAAANAAAVLLGSNNAAVSVPPSVTVAVGQSGALFQAMVGTVNGSQSATITASLDGVSQSVVLSINQPPAPSADSVSPGASAGLTQVFTFVFSDSQSAANLSTAAVLFAPSLAYPDSCFVIYDGNQGTIQLEWDNVTGMDAKPVGSSGTLQNSQCMVGAASVTSSALTNTISLDITFKSAFSGLKNIYLYAADGNGAINTGWVQRGTYAVTTGSAPVPSADSVSPSANAGIAQIFTFNFSDSQSAANLSAAAMLFGSSLTYANSCLVVYDRSQGTIQLEWDNVTGTDAKPVGSLVTLQNSQCLVGAASVTSATLTNTITLAITFKSAFNGLKNIYMYGADGNGAINTGWVQRGTYAVTTVDAPVPSADSVSPSGGGGASQTFTFVFSDSQSAANLSAAAILFAPALAYANSCFVIYDRNQGTIQLEWDNVAGADLKPVGSSIALQNSQCIIGGTTVTTSILSNTITLAITFKSTFSGLKNIYLYGADTDGTLNTGWVWRGTWTPF